MSLLNPPLAKNAPLPPLPTLILGGCLHQGGLSPSPQDTYERLINVL